MADNLNQKTIYVETDYNNIILVDPNKIVINNEVKDRLVVEVLSGHHRLESGQSISRDGVWQRAHSSGSGR